MMAAPPSAMHLSKYKTSRPKHGIAGLFSLLGSLALFANAFAADPLPPAKGTTDGTPVDSSKPVKVFIMLGQSNMLGMGHITKGGEVSLESAVKKEKLYPFLLDDAGNWAERKDVRNVAIMTANDIVELRHNEWLRVGAGSGPAADRLGTEYGIGHHLGNRYAEPVMLLKSCIGNRSLGHDLLPPGSKGFDFVIKDKQGVETTYTYAGYKERPIRWIKGTTPQPRATTPESPIKYDSGYGDFPSPNPRKNKPEPTPTVNPWHGGIHYDWDIGNAKKILTELETYCPGAKSYEVAGFFFWQGEKDCGDPGLAAQYEKNLVHFIHSVRKDFNAPNAKFVLGTLGEHTKEASAGPQKDVLDAHLAVDGESGKHPEFKGNVATVYTHPMARGGSGNGHYNMDSRVYMDVGLSMGEAMVKLLKDGKN